VPIIGVSLQDAVRQFCDHFNRVLCCTITQVRLQAIIAADRATIAFRQYGRAVSATLSTPIGKLELQLSQQCGTVQEGGAHLLYTASYRYAISASPDEEPFIRWEYAKTPESGNQHPRHHIHLNTKLDVLGCSLFLKDLHISTGYVPFEDVIRFCIVELGAKPIQSDWHDMLEASYQKFKSDFVPLRRP